MECQLCIPELLSFLKLCELHYWCNFIIRIFFALLFIFTDFHRFFLKKLLRYSGYHIVIIDNRIYWHTGPVSPRWYKIDEAQRNVQERASKGGKKKFPWRKLFDFFEVFSRDLLRDFVDGIFRIIQLVEVGRIMPTQSNALVWLKRDPERFLNTTSNLKYNNGYNCSYQTHARIFSGMDLNLTNEV